MGAFAIVLGYRIKEATIIYFSARFRCHVPLKSRWWMLGALTRAMWLGKFTCNMALNNYLQSRWAWSASWADPFIVPKNVIVYTSAQGS